MRHCGRALTGTLTRPAGRAALAAAVGSQLPIPTAVPMLQCEFCLCYYDSLTANTLTVTGLKDITSRTRRRRPPAGTSAALLHWHRRPGTTAGLARSGAALVSRWRAVEGGSRGGILARSIALHSFGKTNEIPQIHKITREIGGRGSEN